MEEDGVAKDVVANKKFLGLAGYYLRFAFVKIAKALRDLMKNDLPPDMPDTPEEAVEAFEKLKEAVKSPPTLALSRQKGDFDLDTDYSMYQIDFPLRQKIDDGRLQPIRYWSCVLNEAKVRYSTVEKKALAAVCAVGTFCPYLEGVRFLVRSDQSLCLGCSRVHLMIMRGGPASVSRFQDMKSL